MDTLAADIRSGVRMLASYPALSLVAVLTLGLGIGLSTTVFCVVNGGLFKGLPFPAADRIVALVATNPAQKQPRQPIGAQDVAVFQQRQTPFDKLGAFRFAAINLANEHGRPARFSAGPPSGGGRCGVGGGAGRPSRGVAAGAAGGRDRSVWGPRTRPG